MNYTGCEFRSGATMENGLSQPYGSLKLGDVVLVVAKLINVVPRF
jgi:hypothetical protein